MNPKFLPAEDITLSEYLPKAEVSHFNPFAFLHLPVHVNHTLR